MLGWEVMYHEQGASPSWEIRGLVGKADLHLGQLARWAVMDGKESRRGDWEGASEKVTFELGLE